MVAVAATILVAFSLFGVSLIVSQHEAMTSEIELQANQLSETIKSSTRYAMLRNRPDQVHEIIDTIGQQEGIDQVRIFNKEGKVSYADEKALIGSLVDKDAESCYACHAADAPLERLSMSERTRTFRANGGRRALGIINPIYNTPSCSESDCHAHPASQTVLGVLDVTMSLESVDRQMAANRRRALILVPAAILAASGMIWILFRSLVLKPMQRLVEATDVVASGNLDYRLEVKRNDEFGRLDESFNAMTEKLAEAQKQILQSNKLASLGQLTAGIAHEINNPLTGVLTYSSFLLKRAPADSEMKEDLETVVREAKRCREIVKGLLDFSRQVPTRKTSIDCNQVIDRALGIVDNQLGVRNIQVTKTLQTDLPEVTGDANQLVQVLINLLVNAADAIGDQGGEIFISSGVKDLNGGRHVEIKVADTGCGIPRDQVDQVFDPFFTSKGTEGTGLGLAVVWGIVQEHGGAIRVDSKPERGTTFTLLLPVHFTLRPTTTEDTDDAPM